ncbi:MAG: MFS transporter [Arcanobacterium sp.]|nr:MFS transporter [Arcanobacterium sp.]
MPKLKALSIFATYSELPKLLGKLNFFIAFIGRFPYAMNIIGVLTLITVATGSVSKAAALSAVQAIATGIGNPILGRLTDLFGQRIPLIIAAIGNFLGLTALILSASANTPVIILVLICILIGITNAPLGAFARVRWYHVSKTSPQLSSALSWESTADEMSFVFGPAIVGIASSLIAPTAPLIISASIVISCIIPFALSKHAPGPTKSAVSGTSPKFTVILKRVSGTLIAMLGLGMFFGAMQTATTASALAFGNAGAAGLIYAALGFGAAITALGAVLLPESFSQIMRIITGGITLALLTQLCTLPHSAGLLALTLFIAGLAIGPASVAIFTVTGNRAPDGGSATAITALGSMNVLGVSTTALIAGNLVELNPTYGFYVAGCAALIITLGGLISALQNHS